jgi:2-phospho-L-lactate guanylyltransferase
VPFKGLAAPKRRLAPLLSLTERRGLAQAMLADVLAALARAEGFGRVFVISRDAAALELAQQLGADAMPESGRPGYRAAAEQAAEAARAAGASGLLVLPADLPLVTSTDLECLLIESGRASVTLAPSRHGDGTNALLARPPGVLPYLYGPSSFRAHLRAAERRSLRTAVVDLPNLGLDVDQPSDLLRLLDREAGPRETATRRYVAEIALAERVSAAR